MCPQRDLQAFAVAKAHRRRGRARSLTGPLDDDDKGGDDVGGDGAAAAANVGCSSHAPLPPSYALLGHHARQAGEHIKAAAYYLASAKHSSLDACLQHGILNQGIRYVEEGVVNLAHEGQTVPRSGSGGGPGSPPGGAAPGLLERDLQSVLGAMKVGGRL